MSKVVQFRRPAAAEHADRVDVSNVAQWIASLVTNGGADGFVYALTLNGETVLEGAAGHAARSKSSATEAAKKLLKRVST